MEDPPPPCGLPLGAGHGSAHHTAGAKTLAAPPKPVVDLVRRLVVWGRKDPITPMPPDEVLRTVFSHAYLHPLDGVGHLPHYECPDETAAVLMDFLHNSVADGHDVL